MQFDTAQAGFLGGYLAAGMTKTGKVGTYGAMKIEPVTIFMDGFVDGVAHYNEAKKADVTVLGWDKEKQNGSFSNSFHRPGRGQEGQRRAGRPGCGHHHAGRRWLRPGHHRRRQGRQRQVLGHLGRR